MSLLGTYRSFVVAVVMSLPYRLAPRSSPYLRVPQPDRLRAQLTSTIKQYFLSTCEQDKKRKRVRASLQSKMRGRFVERIMRPFCENHSRTIATVYMAGKIQATFQFVGILEEFCENFRGNSMQLRCGLQQFLPQPP